LSSRIRGQIIYPGQTPAPTPTPNSPMNILRHLSITSHSNGFTQWHFRAEAHRLSEVFQRGFFARAADLLTRGDMVVVNATDGNAIGFIQDAGARIVLVAPGAGKFKGQTK
jgi:hypothetical protein